VSFGQGIGQPLVLADMRHHVERLIGWKPTGFESVLIVGVGVGLGGR